SFYAFSFTRPSQSTTPSFVIAGGAELRGGAGSYPERTVRYRDVSPDGIKEKVRFTTREMEGRMDAFGFGWKDTTAVQAYTVHDFHPVVADELARCGGQERGEVRQSSLPRIERVAQAVADQIERQHYEENREPRPYRHPWRIGQETLRGVEHAAPGRRRRLLS